MQDPHDVASDKAPHSQTVAVHGGETRPRPLDSITTPIVAASTYRFEDTASLIAHVEGDAPQSDYGRYANPTVRAAELKIAAMEGAGDTMLVASGMAAITTAFFALLKTGDHVVFTGDIYRPTAEFIRGTLGKFGISSTMTPPGDLEALEAAIEDGTTKVVFTESPSNPHLYVYDLDALAAIRKRHRGVKLVVDSTLGSPFNQRPLAHGADLSIQSATKFLGGHNDLLAGAVSGRSGMIDAIRETRSILGPVFDAHPAYLLLRGMKTFPVRMQRHNDNALAVARFLQEHPNVGSVYYPGLPTHPSHETAAAQMKGYGGVVTFTAGETFDHAAGVCDACEIIQIGASLGGVESLIHQPVVFSYWDLTPEQRTEWGIADNLIRLSVGLETVDDLIADLRQALDTVS